jgi:hypothetical protein
MGDTVACQRTVGREKSGLDVSLTRERRKTAPIWFGLGVKILCFGLIRSVGRLAKEKGRPKAPFPKSVTA